MTEQPGEKFEAPTDTKLRAGSWVNIEDPFGIVAVFATHLEIALNHSHPEKAFEAAQHATRAYIQSYDFVEVSEPGSPAPKYRKVRRKQIGGDPMK